MSTPLIERELALHTHFRKRLAEEFPDADEDTLADTLEGLSNLRDQLAAVVRSALDDESLVEALRRRMDEMRERASRLARRAETKRRLVTETMARAELMAESSPPYAAQTGDNIAPVMRRAPARYERL